MFIHPKCSPEAVSSQPSLEVGIFYHPNTQHPRLQRLPAREPRVNLMPETKP
jgi:hypothetical protein